MKQSGINLLVAVSLLAVVASSGYIMQTHRGPLLPPSASISATPANMLWVDWSKPLAVQGVERGMTPGQVAAVMGTRGTRMKWPEEFDFTNAWGYGDIHKVDTEYEAAKSKPWMRIYFAKRHESESAAVVDVIYANSLWQGGRKLFDNGDDKDTVEKILGKAFEVGNRGLIREYGKTKENTVRVAYTSDLKHVILVGLGDFMAHRLRH